MGQGSQMRRFGLPRIIASVALLTLMVLALSSVSAAPSSDLERTLEVSSDLRVTALEFGRFDFDRARGTSVFTPAREIQMVPGVGYGWRMHVRTSRSEIAWTEQLALPSAPKTWGITSNVTLSADRRRATTRGVSTPNEGVIDNAWIFADGDPPGIYSIDVEIDGKLIGRGEVRVRSH
ncbi:MAG: hypothetical protein VX475_12950 [Myxococcota bacterium]|nr:hypothetical protein [Myxococcota bacterium]